MSSTELQNMYSSFYVVERTRTSENNENVQNMQNCFSLSKLICKFIRCLLPSSSWLLKLPNDTKEKTKGEFLDPLRDVFFWGRKNFKQCQGPKWRKRLPSVVTLIRGSILDVLDLPWYTSKFLLYADHRPLLYSISVDIWRNIHWKVAPSVFPLNKANTAFINSVTSAHD